MAVCDEVLLSKDIFAACKINDKTDDVSEHDGVSESSPSASGVFLGGKFLPLTVRVRVYLLSFLSNERQRQRLYLSANRPFYESVPDDICIHTQ